MYNERTRRDRSDFFLSSLDTPLFVLIKQFYTWDGDSPFAKGQTVQKRDLCRGRIKSIRIFYYATLYVLSLVTLQINSFDTVLRKIFRGSKIRGIPFFFEKIRKSTPRKATEEIGSELNVVIRRIPLQMNRTSSYKEKEEEGFKINDCQVYLSSSLKRKT